MRYRLFGRTGLRVSELFLGAMAFGRNTDLDEARRIVDVYAEAGGNVIDTANYYSAGTSESILGQAVEGRRDRFVLATKYTLSRDSSDLNAAGNHRKSMTLALEESLRRLRTDYLDVYWVHLWDRHTPLEETMRALDDAVRSGKVLYVGISDAPAWVVARANTLAEWRDWTPFAGLQVPYSLLNRDIERELLPMAEEFGMTVAAWSTLGHGVLSGKYTRPGADDSLGPREHAVAKTVQEVADDLGATSAQVAIAWTRAHSPAVHPILGASRADQVAGNLGALDVVLPAATLERLEAAAEFSLGFPGDFIAEVAEVFGDDYGKLDGRQR